MKLLPILCACLLLVGCSKKESEEPTPVPVEEVEKPCYLHHVQTDVTYASGWQISMEESYTYATKAKLYSKKMYMGGEYAYGSTYTYDAQGRIVRETFFGQYSEPDSYSSFTYDAQGRVASFKVYEYNQQTKQYAFKSRSVCEYVTANELKALYTFTSVDGQDELRGTTEYTYSGGLMTKATWYNSKKELQGEVTLTYDNKKNFVATLPAYRAVQLISGFPHEHNITSYTLTDAGGKKVEGASYTRTATYTEKGYLESATSTYLNGKVEKHSYTHDCE